MNAKTGTLFLVPAPLDFGCDTQAPLQDALPEAREEANQALALDPHNVAALVMLGFVVLLTVCHGLARMTAGRMVRTGDQSLYPRMELLVSGVWMSALAAIILAVLAFET